MAKKYDAVYAVEGRFEFPLDMLRYDYSYPSTEHDANVAQYSSELRTVTLRRRDCERHWTPNVERWKSFGWTVKGLEMKDY